MSSSTSTTEAVRNDTRFFGHPLPLMQLFSLELWERFSYYGMNGILAIYLYFSVTNGGLGLDKGTAVGIVGAYGGAVFLATILGAWVADRLAGAEKVLFYSAVIIMIGHICLALVPGFGGVALGLILVALGSGGLKANASALVGELYEEKDPRRDAGFTIFYMGVNIGAMFGPLITGILQKEVGFHYGFGAAAVGMALGLIIYVTGRKNLPPESRTAVNPLPKSKLYLFIVAVVAVIVLAIVLWMTKIVNPDNIDWWIAGISAAAAACYIIVMYTSPQTNTEERSRVLAFIPFFLTSVVFWSMYQQIFGVLTVYSDTQLNRSIFGWEMPAIHQSMLFGSTLTALTALTNDIGRPEEAGLIYGVMGIGSAVMAISVAAFPSSFTLWARLLCFSPIMVVGSLLLASTESMPIIVVALLLMGSAIGPSLVTLFSLAAERSPRGRSATVMSMAGSAIIVGQSVSSAINGVLADVEGTATAMAVPVAASAVVLIAGVLNLFVAFRPRGRGSVHRNSRQGSRAVIDGE